MYSVVFESEESVVGLQGYYDDFDYFGKHFLVYHKDNKSKKRQYTLCNCMQTEVYNEYLRVIGVFMRNSGKIGKASNRFKQSKNLISLFELKASPK